MTADIEQITKPLTDKIALLERAIETMEWLEKRDADRRRRHDLGYYRLRFVQSQGWAHTDEQIDAMHQRAINNQGILPFYTP